MQGWGWRVGSVGLGVQGWGCRVGGVSLGVQGWVCVAGCVRLGVYRGTSLIRNGPPPRTTIGP